MARFDRIDFAPLGMRRDSRAASSSLTRDERTQIYHCVKRELTDPISPFGQILAAVTQDDAYVMEHRRAGEASLTVRWLSGARLELAAVSVLLSGVDRGEEITALTAAGEMLLQSDHPEPAIAEILSRTETDPRRPLMASVYLYERSYDSVTINQWSMGIAHAFFDLVAPSQQRSNPQE